MIRVFLFLLFVIWRRSFLPCETLSRISLMYAMWRLQVSFCTLSLLLSLSSAAESKARSCSDARQAYNAKGFSLVNVPHQEISGRRHRLITSRPHSPRAMPPWPPHPSLNWWSQHTTWTMWSPSDLWACNSASYRSPLFILVVYFIFDQSLQMESKVRVCFLQHAVDYVSWQTLSKDVMCMQPVCLLGLLPLCDKSKTCHCGRVDASCFYNILLLLFKVQYDSLQVHSCSMMNPRVSFIILH